jgi:hypothetical protein
MQYGREPAQETGACDRPLFEFADLSSPSNCSGASSCRALD